MTATEDFTPRPRGPRPRGIPEAMLPKVKELQRLQAEHNDAQTAAELARNERNRVVVELVEGGVPQALVAEITGMSRGRIGQLVERPRD